MESGPAEPGPAAEPDAAAATGRFFGVGAGRGRTGPRGARTALFGNGSRGIPGYFRLRLRGVAGGRTPPRTRLVRGAAGYPAGPATGGRRRLAGRGTRIRADRRGVAGGGRRAGIARRRIRTGRNALVADRITGCRLAGSGPVARGRCRARRARTRGRARRRRLAVDRHMGGRSGCRARGGLGLLARSGIRIVARHGGIRRRGPGRGGVRIGCGPRSIDARGGVRIGCGCWSVLVRDNVRIVGERRPIGVRAVGGRIVRR